MKKLLTLFIAAGAFISVNAQSTRDEARKVILGQEKKESSTNREGRDIVLGGGNGNNGNYPNYPNSRTTSRNKQHGNKKSCNSGKGKGNNGNHYGWEKGKGNPHKNGGKSKHYKKHDD